MLNQLTIFDSVRFNGSDYIRSLDDKRLTGQLKRIYNCMIDGKFRTLGEIADVTGDPQASISAQLRHLRKPRFGSHTINKQRRGNREEGLFEYQLKSDMVCCFGCGIQTHKSLAIDNWFVVSGHCFCRDCNKNIITFKCYF